MCKNAIQIDWAGLEGPISIKKKVMYRRKKTITDFVLYLWRATDLIISSEVQNVQSTTRSVACAAWESWQWHDLRMRAAAQCAERLLQSHGGVI